LHQKAVDPHICEGEVTKRTRYSDQHLQFGRAVDDVVERHGSTRAWKDAGWYGLGGIANSMKEIISRDLGH
jgi:hypothetical protein